jgi:hypothetical protein
VKPTTHKFLTLFRKIVNLNITQMTYIDFTDIAILIDRVLYRLYRQAHEQL